MRRLWGLLALALLAIPASARAQIVINEIHYEPPEKTVPEEFIELHNAGGELVDLSGWFFSSGVDYVIPDGTTLAPGGFVVVGESPETLAASFGVVQALGPWDGRLENDGERVVLRDSSGAIRDEVDFSLGSPWPVAPAGDGGSMELINSSLDNDLGGSWRPSGQGSAPSERVHLIVADEQWRYRKATSEASDPPQAWREPEFTEDGSWQEGQTPVGFGDDDDNTLLEDMRGNYTGVYLRKSFQYDGEELPDRLMAGLWVDDGCIVWINGIEIVRLRVGEGEVPFDGKAARSFEARDFENELLGSPAAYLRRGENVIAVHALNLSATSADFSIDVTLFEPAEADLIDLPAFPTPGSRNNAWAENAPPQVRQVSHDPQQPAGGEAIVVTAKVTDPQGVASVEVLYQIVEPGNYIPAYLPLPQNILIANALTPNEPNPEFEDPASWIALTMLDDGQGADGIADDDTYSAQLPAQDHRTLVRYRIRVVDGESLAGRSPQADDPSLNFACFVYDGVPDYVASTRSVHPDGVGHVYSAELMERLPVYHVITRGVDMSNCVAYSGSFQIPKSNERARDKFNWEAAFVYEGKVYDHIRYRLRQANDRYGGAGKRSYRFRFNRGDFLRARDNYGKRYPEPWRTLNTGKGFDNKDVGNFGLTEAMNANLWNLVGAPAPWFNTFHMRVIDHADEVPTGSNGQYLGDFWGMMSGIEDYDPRFLRAHDMVDGNLYKLKDGQFNGNDLKRNQSRWGTTGDEDFQNIRANLRPQRDEEWLDSHVNYSRWYPYHAVVEGIRHYDFKPADSHSKNRAWYFEPYEDTEFGRLWTLPWDSDASWGPNWNQGIDYTKNAIFAGGKQRFLQEYRNFMREFRDLVWTEEVIETMIDDLAGFVGEFSKADRDRWRGAPAAAGRQDFGPIETKILDMKRFAFVGWSGGSGPTVPAGGRARYLDTLANAGGDSTRIPQTPVVTSISPEGFPADRLTFATSPFVDQDDSAFAGLRWRLGEVTPADAPFDLVVQRQFEYPAIWEVELDTFEGTITVPRTAVRPGATYRVRARMKDDTERWGHWSAPVEFVVGNPEQSSAQEAGLRITELMYNPLDDEDFEFIEIQNIGAAPVDLVDVALRDGVEFEFSSGDVASLAPGEYVVVVKNSRVFATRYPTAGIRIAGEYSGRLANDGERVELAWGRGATVLAFEYDDEWYGSTDGEGRSLVIADAGAAVEAWGTAAGWQPSADTHGTPGRPEGEVQGGGQFAGDVDQDGRRNVSDAIAILQTLFGGRGPLPCGDGTIDHPSNRAILDLDGAGSVNLSDAVYLLNYLFGSGPPPALGRECVRVVGCADVCLP